MSKAKLSPPDSPPELPGALSGTTKAVSVQQRAVACLQYGIVSVSITLFNRAVFSVYHFNFPAFVTLVQLVVSIAYIYALKFTNKLRVSDLTWAGARQVRGVDRSRVPGTLWPACRALIGEQGRDPRAGGPSACVQEAHGLRAGLGSPARHGAPAPHRQSLHRPDPAPPCRRRPWPCSGGSTWCRG